MLEFTQDRLQTLINGEKVVNKVFYSFFVTEKGSEILLESRKNPTLKTQPTPVISRESSRCTGGQSALEAQFAALKNRLSFKSYVILKIQTN